LLASVKPSFVLVAFLPVLVVANLLFRPRPIRQKIALASGAAACGILLLLPEHSLSRNDENSRTFLPTTLFVIHANLIRDQMADDLRRGAQIPYLREWLESVYAALSAEIANSVTGEPKLGVKSLEFPLYRETWTAYPPAVDFMDHARFLARTRHWFNSGPSFASRSVF